MRIQITFLLVMLVSLMQAQTTMVAFKAPESTPENAKILVGSSSWQGGWDASYGLPDHGYELTKAADDDYYRVEVPADFCNAGIRFILNGDPENIAQWLKDDGINYDTDSWGNEDYKVEENGNIVYYFNQFVAWKKEVIVKSNEIVFHAPESTPADAVICVGSTLFNWDYGFDNLTNVIEMEKGDDGLYRAEVETDFVVGKGLRFVLMGDNGEVDNVAVWRTERNTYDIDSWDHDKHIIVEDYKIIYDVVKFYDWRKNVENTSVSILFHAPESTPANGIVYVGSRMFNDDFGFTGTIEALEMEKGADGIYKVTTTMPFVNQPLRFVLVDEDNLSFDNIALYLKAKPEDNPDAEDEYDRDSWDHVVTVGDDDAHVVEISKFVKWTVNSSVGLYTAPDAGEAIIFAGDKSITIESGELSEVTVYDLLGNVCLKKNVQKEIIPFQGKGVYIVQLLNNSGKVTKKVVLK